MLKSPGQLAFEAFQHYGNEASNTITSKTWDTIPEGLQEIWERAGEAVVKEYWACTRSKFNETVLDG